MKVRRCYGLKMAIRPKTLMVSVTEHDGLLALTDDQYLKAHDTTSNISKYACKTIKYGALEDGYCDNDKFLKHISKLLIWLKVNSLVINTN